MRGLLVLCILVAPLLAGCLEGTILTMPVDEEGLSQHPTKETGWPALEDAIIRPGVVVHGIHRECVSNFVFARPDNNSIFLGITANCVRDMVVGDIVVMDPGRTDATGVIIYHSWQTMSDHDEKDPEAWEYNDFAIVRIDEKFRHLVHPAALGRGGPTALADATSVGTADRLLVYSTLPTLPVRGWHDAVVVDHVSDWALVVYGLPPALPGHLGGGVTTPEGEALGVVVNVGVLPHVGTNGVARLDKLMQYGHEHANLYMDLATWDVLSGARGPL